jgi:hypothetical protein
VDYDTDSQKGISVGSPFSLQLAFSSPLSLDKDLSACMALLRNSPAKTSSESSLNFIGNEELLEADKKEHEGTSHAQVSHEPNGCDSIVSISALSLTIPAGEYEDKGHPPIRSVRSLTPPGK